MIAFINKYTINKIKINTNKFTFPFLDMFAVLFVNKNFELTESRYKLRAPTLERPKGLFRPLKTYKLHN